MDPQITTVIPTYRRPSLVRRAVLSVLGQTYPDLVVHVYDNASGDETANVVNELARQDPRVKYHCHRENLGAHENFNFGMSHVDTPFFSLLSDDDALLPRFYESAMAAFERYGEAGIFAGVTLRSDFAGHVLDVPMARWAEGLYRPPTGLMEILRKEHPDWTGVVFRKDVCQTVGLLDSETGVASDYDFELRATARFALVVSAQPCAVLFSHPEALTVRRTLTFTGPVCCGWPRSCPRLRR